ncbi:helix-turn-helix transcriptional regulator [Bifidobacterium sp. ESL0690]|uniref:helix-turn-helix domain-containing protein n=1 Tax=Bifidobacterium sp. ESL0690 TaxID=2983214 RepID=UPI0023F63DC2|nr:helix-turn-helix transcriptional regulator [Bifidobacterium sp. ESL0690]WEV46393.1 helix-turn-helix transcriptional regulator [Bifidobacterium sp. ESL0690]
MKYVPVTARRDLRTLGRQFATQRKLLKLRVADVAQRAGVSQSTVANLEHGKAVGSDALLAIARILQLADYMVKSTDPYSHTLGIVRATENLPKRVR